MKTKLLLLFALLFGCCNLAVAQEHKEKAPQKSHQQEVDANGVPVPPKYTCLAGASYTYPIWAEKYPFPTGQSGFYAHEPEVAYRRYLPTSAEVAVAEKVCAAQLQKYLENLGRAEQATFDEQDKDIKAPPAKKTDVNKVANCARRLCAAGMKLDSSGEVYFDYKDERYTLGAGSESLAVYVRPSGTTSRSELMTYVDHALDGTVDEASDGYHRNRYFKSWGPKLFGLQWRGYYQQGYNQALATIFDYISSHPKQ